MGGGRSTPLWGGRRRAAVARLSAAGVTVRGMAWEVEKRYRSEAPEPEPCTGCGEMTSHGMVIEVYSGTPPPTLSGLLCEQCYASYCAETA